MAADCTYKWGRNTTGILLSGAWTQQGWDIAGRDTMGIGHSGAGTQQGFYLAGLAWRVGTQWGWDTAGSRHS